MAIKVRLKDPTKIAWDREAGVVITGSDEFTVEETHFIRNKIKEGVLFEIKVPTVKEEAEETVIPETPKKPVKSKVNNK